MEEVEEKLEKEGILMCCDQQRKIGEGSRRLSKETSVMN